MTAADGNVMYKLEKGYQITRVLGKECLMILRDKYSTPLATIELCRGKISSVTPYRGAENDRNHIRVIQRFVRRYHYSLTAEAALNLSLNVVKRDGKETYYTSSELTASRLERLFKNYDTLAVTLNNFRKRKLIVPSSAKKCSLNLSHAIVSKLIVSRNSHAAIDLRDNRFVETLIIGDSFRGSLNFSRSDIQNIKLGNNCRCDIFCIHSGKCFEMTLGDVYSGILDVRDSCFHRIKTGYYCYAVIRLSENWGKKDVIIGDSFRGSLFIDSVLAENVEIGDDCRGRISVREHNRRQGIKHIDIADGFKGEIDLASALALQKVEVGAHAAGSINLSSCPSIQAVKFEEDFSGRVDLRNSGVIYVRAKDGCSGRFVLLHCENLSLLRLPRDKRADIAVERMPQSVGTDSRNFYYHFDEKELPAELSSPFYAGWVKKLRHFIHRHFIL